MEGVKSKSKSDQEESTLPGLRTNKGSFGSHRSSDSRKNISNDFEDMVRFPSLPDVAKQTIIFSPMGSGNATHMHPQIRDETLLLFDCMPKGLESFLETGPSRRVVDYMDYEKMCHTQRKKVQYLKEQQVPQANRAKDIFEKSMELQEHFKNFDIFVSDAQKKRTRAKEYYVSCRNVNRELDVELPRAARKLSIIKEIRDRLMSRVNKLQPVDEFIDLIIRQQDSQFPNFNAIMDRNSTLHLTNKYLTKRFTERHIVEKQLHEELQTISNDAKTHDIFIRREINVLKKELSRLTRENIDLEQKCMKWAESTNDRFKQIFQMDTSIRNMSRIIMEVRPYAAKHFVQMTNLCEMIDKIGLFISDYSEITRAFSEAKVKKKAPEKKEPLYSD